MPFNIEVWAVIISAAGIIATCFVESFWFKRQMEQQSKQFKNQTEQQTRQLKEQFQFELGVSRQQRIFQDQREVMAQVRKVVQGLVELEQIEAPVDRARLAKDIDFDMFALSATARNLVEDSEEEHGTVLHAKLTDMAKQVPAVAKEAVGQQPGIVIAGKVQKAIDLLHEFSELVLQTTHEVRESPLRTG